MDPTARNDAELVATTLAGDRESFGELYDRYARMVRAVVVGISGDWPAVEDMTQECFLRAYRKLNTLRDPARFGPWIVGVARHVARERRRSLRRDRHRFGDVPQDAGTATDGLATVQDRDQLEMVIERLADLSERERLAVHAYFLDEQNAGQAAKLLGLSRSGFYATVQRAIAQLAAELRPCATKERSER